MKSCPRCNLRYPDHASSCFIDGAELVPTKDPRIGTTLAGRYEITDMIAEGGMGTVYLSRHRIIDRPCAIKIMRASLVRNKIVRERFRREAKATQKLAHPNIIEILDHGDTTEGLPFMVMEYLEGETLAHAIRRGSLPLDQVFSAAIQITRALARAHDFDVVHRDLKPDNIFLCKTAGASPLVKLLDFGIARSLHDERLTHVGDVFGTPQYMAPERITSIDAGPLADLYALGVIIFEMTVGRLPFIADDIGRLFAMHMKDAVPSLQSLQPAAPEALDTLVRSLMAKAPAARPVDAHRVLSDLVAICSQQGIPIPPDPQTSATLEDPPPKTLPPTSLDHWGRRLLVFEQMLLRAWSATPPAEVKQLFIRIQKLVRDIGLHRTEAMQEQRKLGALEARLRDGRQRLGFAVDALGVDVSRVRDALREARTAADAGKAMCDAHANQFRQTQRDVLLWEGRSAFVEPSAELGRAYRTASDQMDAWVLAGSKQLHLQEHAASLASTASDLEYQLDELRAGLTRLEQSAEQERSSIQARASEILQRADTLEQDLLQAASEFCTPLRSRHHMEDLFQELEDGAG